MSDIISKVVVKLKDLSHTYPDDLDILLVGPGGQTVLLMPDASGTSPNGTW
jgi:subtilisin-like proprotein convertase family protein